MKNKNKTVWSNRFGKTNSKNFQRIGASINVDKRLYNEDIQASIVHVQMLIKKSIIPKKDGIKIIKGLKKISSSEILVSVTGVAGPDGGSSKTPVGCVYFGLGTKIKNKYYYTTIKKIFRERTRKRIQEKSTEFILKEIIKNLSKI